MIFHIPQYFLQQVMRYIAVQILAITYLGRPLSTIGFHGIYAAYLPFFKKE